MKNGIGIELKTYVLGIMEKTVKIKVSIYYCEINFMYSVYDVQLPLNVTHCKYNYFSIVTHYKIDYLWVRHIIYVIRVDQSILGGIAIDFLGTTRDIVIFVLLKYTINYLDT